LSYGVVVYSVSYRSWRRVPSVRLQQGDFSTRDDRLSLEPQYQTFAGFPYR
jgi:hypothetical protein